MLHVAFFLFCCHPSHESHAQINTWKDHVSKFNSSTPACVILWFWKSVANITWSFVQQYKIHTSCLKCKYSFESWNHNIHTHDYAKLNYSPESLYKQRIQTEESNGKLNSNSISLIFCFTLLLQMKKVYEKDWISNKQWKVLPFYKGITNA